MNLIYDMYGAALNHQYDHPQKVMRDLGVTYTHSVPQSLGDCWWFLGCSSVPDKMPTYIKELEINPSEFIGKGLSNKEVSDIKEMM